jgi:glycosyltransferase involved in cell wall biosynthesis
MKIGFLLQAVAAAGGLGNGVRLQGLSQARALSRLGHEVTLINPWVLRTADDFDIVHFFGGGFGYFGLESSSRKWIKKLVFSPIIDSNQSFPSYRFAAKLGALWPGRIFTIPGELGRQARASDLVICRSAHEKERMIQSLGVDPHKCEIVRNGVDPPPPCDPDGVRRRLQLPERFVLHVSAYTQSRKNVARLIQAVGPTGLPLVIAGTAVPGPDLDQIQELARAHANVTLLGWQDQKTLYDLYAACTVFCLPSVHEGTGLAALEAAACGAEIVITKNGGPPDYFGDMATYVDPSDTSGIRRAVLELWERPKGDRLQRHVLQNLTWDRSAEKLVECYQRLTG